MTRRIQAVVFDLGETLVNENRLWSMIARYSGITDFTLFGMMGAVIERREHHRSIFSLMQIESVEPAIIGYELGLQDLYPDVIPALRSLHAAGYRLGVSGNQPEGAAEQTSRMGLPFEVVASSAIWGVAKPDPAFFQRVTESFDLPPDAIVYVGDRLDNDIFPAIAAGMHAVFIRRGPWGHIHALWPEAEQVPFQIRGLSELSPILERLNAEAASTDKALP
jgi:FMN phosphatase YigB (HAD superfamily)